MAGLAVYHWNRLPVRIPIHFGLDGRPDGWGGRFEGLVLLPLIAMGVYALLRVAPRFDPGRANYADFAASYATIRLAVLALLGVVYGFMIQSYYDHAIQSSRWMPVLLGGLFVVLGNVMGKLRPNWLVGVRTPWTLSSKLSWNRTHRLAGWLMVSAGLVFWLAAVAAPGQAMLVGMVAMVTGALTSVVYSYVVWRDDPDKTPPAGTSPAEEPRP